MSRDNLKFHIGHNLDAVRRSLSEQIRRGLCFCREAGGNPIELGLEAQRITDQFLLFLPELRTTLMSDIAAAFEGDPAATSPDETLFSYPGVRAITNYRIANRLHTLRVPILPRMITEHAHSRTGIDIHPGATIDSHFFIDHGTGVVIGETCVIGKRVRLYQGVTLGAKSFPLDAQGKPIKGIPRHPIIEDEVVIYSGATILGRITIGKGSMIGGNVWLTQSVPAGSKVSQQEPQPRMSNS
jgi:serine O-acetyltransferase